MLDTKILFDYILKPVDSLQDMVGILIIHYNCSIDIGFVYQSMEELAKEDSSEMEQTQEYDTGANIMDATLIGRFT